VKRRTFICGAAFMIGVPAVPGWSPAGPIARDEIGDQVQTVPRGRLPAFARAGTPDTQRLYRYAAEHGDELHYIPCFCGCERFGHKSNRDCYIKSVHGDGSITFTSHAAT
jgi:hypothetical protein